MKDEDIVLGDLLHKTPECGAHYPGWTVEGGVVISVKKKYIFDSAMGGTDRATYRARYGYQEKYPSMEIIISTSQGDFQVSPFQFNKDR